MPKPIARSKTRKSVAKRFKITARGKVLRAHSSRRHLLSAKNAKRKRRLSKAARVDNTDVARIKANLPFGSAFRSTIQENWCAQCFRSWGLRVGILARKFAFRQGLWIEDLQIPPGQECSNGSLILLAVVLWRTFCSVGRVTPCAPAW